MTGSSPKTLIGTNPFVGPHPIETGQRIFGRDREIEELYYLLSAERIVLLHSPSGAGKSSLVQAGLMPRLAQRFDVWGPARVNLQPPEVNPDAVNRYARSAMLGFEAKIPQLHQRPQELISGITLSEYVAGRPRRRSAPQNIVLIFDQFEEILTVDALAQKVKHEFFDQLGWLLQDPKIWALFALREEYLAPLDPYAEQVPTHLKNRFRLDLLSREAAGEAIAGPVAEGGREFVLEAVGKLVNDLATMQVQRPDGTFEKQIGPCVEPMHLQVAGRGLWEQMPEDKLTINVDDIQSFGNVTDALSEYYASEVARIAGGDERVERAIREWVDKKLITPDKIRGQVLRGADRSEGLDNELVAMLVDSHLVRGEQRAGATWYELAHDRLIVPVRGNNKEWFDAKLSKAQKVAAVWEAQGRPEGLLLASEELTDAKRWALENESGLTGIERRFLEASTVRQEAIGREQKQARRLRFWLKVAVVAAVAALAASLFAWRQWWVASEQERRARIALGRSSVQDAERFLEAGRPDQALAYLARALRVDPDSVAARSWISDLLLRRSWWFPSEPLRHAGIVYSAVLSPDGRRIVTVSKDKTAHVWEADTGKPVGEPLRPEDSVNSAVFSPDGRRIVTVSKDKTARVWEADTGKPVGEPLRHQDSVNSAVFSPDGRRIVTVSKDKTARVWEADTGKPVGEPLRPEDSVNSAVFSPDGRRIVTVSKDKTARVWEADTGKPVGEPLRHEDSVNSAVFSPDGRRIVTASRNLTLGISLFKIAFHGEKTARVWEADTGKPVGEPLRHEDSVNSAVFSPDGRRIVTASEDKTARVWEADTGKPVGEPLRHQDSVNSAVFSPDGRCIVTVSKDKTARVWEADTGKPVGEPLRHQGPVNSAVFSPDGRRIVTASDDRTTRVWEVLLGSGSRNETDRLADLANAVGGYEVNKLGSPVPLEDQVERLHKLRQSVGQVPQGTNTLDSFLLRFLPDPR